MKQPLITVVVPVYKVEEFLPQCIESILLQTYKELHVVLVDDGSPDRCGEICDEYASKDSRITVIHQENGGVTRARAAGVNAAGECDYITFVDSDDSLPPTALQDLYALTGKDYDIVVGTYDRNPKHYADGVIDKLELVRKIYDYTIASSPYAKLFRRELFDESTFDLPRDFVMGEDFIMNLRLAFACQRKVRIAPVVVYYYNDNAGGVMSTFHYTLDYLERSYHFKKSAIPEVYREECMPHCIASILQSNHIIVRHYYHNKTHEMTSLHREIVEDIRCYGCRAMGWERFALRFSSPLYSGFYLWVRGAVQWLKKLKRRLSNS